MNVLRYIQLFALYFRLSVQGQLEYPMRLASWVVLIPLQFFSGLLMLKILTINFNEIAGWGFDQLVLLYGVSMLSNALFMTFFIATWNIESLVIRGELDLCLTRPVNVLFQVLFRHPNVLGLAEVIPSVIIVGYAWKKLGLETGNVMLWLVLIVFVAAATLLRAGIFLILGSTAFWLKKSKPLVSGGAMLIDRATYYPVSVYPIVVQWVVTLAFPLAFISYYPTRYLLEYQGFDKIDQHVAFILAPLLAGLITFLIGVGVFYKGFSVYESAGS